MGGEEDSKEDRDREHWTISQDTDYITVRRLLTFAKIAKIEAHSVKKTPRPAQAKKRPMVVMMLA